MCWFRACKLTSGCHWLRDHEDWTHKAFFVLKDLYDGSLLCQLSYFFHHFWESKCAPLTAAMGCLKSLAWSPPNGDSSNNSNKSNTCNKGNIGYWRNMANKRKWRNSSNKRNSSNNGNKDGAEYPRVASNFLLIWNTHWSCMMPIDQLHVRTQEGLPNLTR